MVQQAELRTNITADKSQFSKTINQAKIEANGFAAKLESNFKKIGKGLAAGVSIFSLGISTLAATQFDEVDKLSAAASKLDIAASSLQFLQYAAKRSDVEIGVLEQGLTKLRFAIGKAEAGNKNLNSAFKELGLSADELGKLKLDDAYVKISEAIRKVGDSTRQAYLAQIIFGKSGQEQLNALRSDLKGTKKDFDDLGTAIDDSKLGNFSKADKAIDNLREKISGELKKAIIELSPLIEKIADGFGLVLSVASSVANKLTSIVNTLGSGLSSAITLVTDQLSKLNGTAYDPNAINPAATVSNRNLLLKGASARVGANIGSGAGDVASNQALIANATSSINKEQKIVLEVKTDKNGLIDAMVNNANAQQVILKYITQAAAREAQATAL